MKLEKPLLMHPSLQKFHSIFDCTLKITSDAINGNASQLINALLKRDFKIALEPLSEHIKKDTNILD